MQRASIQTAAFKKKRREPIRFMPVHVYTRADVSSDEVKRGIQKREEEDDDSQLNTRVMSCYSSRAGPLRTHAQSERLRRQGRMRCCHARDEDDMLKLMWDGKTSEHHVSHVLRVRCCVSAVISCVSSLASPSPSSRSSCLVCALACLVALISHVSHVMLHIMSSVLNTLPPPPPPV